jgi:hypothetical protein
MYGSQMPWPDTPDNRARWQQLQNNTAFLRAQQQRYGTLRCHYCGTGPLTIYSWDDPRNNSSDKVKPWSRLYGLNIVFASMLCNLPKPISQLLL